MESPQNDMLSDITTMLNGSQEQESTEEVQETQEEATEETSTEETTEAQTQETTEQTSEEESTESSLTEETQTQEEVESFDLLSYVRENRELIDLKLIDFDKVDLNDNSQTEDLLIKKLVRDGYTEEEAFTLLEDKYPTFFDEYADTEDEDVKKLLKREYVKMKSEARTVVAELKAKQAETELNIPNMPSANAANDSVIAEFQKEQQAKYQEQLQAAQATRETLATELNSLEKVTFNSGEDSTIEYELTPEDKTWISSEMQTIDQFFSKNFSKENGDVDNEKLLKTLIAGKNIEQIIRIAKGQGNGEGRKDLITKDLKNNTMSNKSSSADRRKVVGNSVEEQGAAAISEGKLNINRAF